MRKKICVIYATSLLLFLGCSNLNTDVTDYKLENKSTIIRCEAEKYISNMYVWDNISTGRSIYETKEWPSFLSSLYIEDSLGKQLFFDNFTDDEKKAFATFWYETEVSTLADALEEDFDALEYIRIENMAMEKAVKNVSRSLTDGEQGELFVKEYLRSLKSDTNRKMIVARSGTENNNITNTVSSKKLNTKSVEELKSVYTQGYVLISDMASSSGSNIPYAGHAAIMHKKKWDPTWTDNPFAKITISSWGGGVLDWPGKTNGVQEEPLVYWTGTLQGSANKVTVVRMRRKRWVWDWFKSGIRYYNASISDSEKAANNAQRWIGKKYATFSLGAGITSEVLTPIGAPITYTTAMIARNSEKEFYCSQLVWRSWYKVSSEFDINPAKPVILPSDLLPFNSGGVTIPVTSYRNK